MESRFLKSVKMMPGVHLNLRRRVRPFPSRRHPGSEACHIEIKWHGQPRAGAELHTLQGKIDQKSASTRARLVSNSGFTVEDIAACRSGWRGICVVGLDLYETLDPEMLLAQVFVRKGRCAAGTGSPFIRVRHLFPQ